MLRISATALESFRLWSDPEQEWMSEADLIAGLRGKFEPTPAIELGKAFGLVLEDPDRYLVPGGFSCRGQFFAREVMDPALAVIDRRTAFEVQSTKRYGDGVEVVSRADGLLGAQLLEFKTTLGGFVANKYIDSCQWQFMADIFQPSRVTYHVFCLKEPKRTGEIELDAIETINLYPYPALSLDCAAMVARFVHYARVRDLLPLFEGKAAAGAKREIAAA
jgi:hypothetical protein